MNPLGILLTHWTIRVALACYAVAMSGEIAGWNGPSWRRVQRWFWTAGCLAFLGHVAAALHFYHDWSHQHVVALTARRTHEIIGWAFGEGIFFSYLFTILWTVDCLWWWLRPTAYLARPRWLRLGIHGYLLFIAINGSMIFESGVTRWTGLVCCLLFATLAIRRVVAASTLQRVQAS